MCKKVHIYDLPLILLTSLGAPSRCLGGGGHSGISKSALSEPLKAIPQNDSQHQQISILQNEYLYCLALASGYN